MLEFLQLVLK